MSGWFKESLPMYHNNNIDGPIDNDLLDSNKNPFVGMVMDEGWVAIKISLNPDEEETQDGSTSITIDLTK